jgi:hypothetical protein
MVTVRSASVLSCGFLPSYLCIALTAALSDLSLPFLPAASLAPAAFLAAVYAALSVGSFK